MFIFIMNANVKNKNHCRVENKIGNSFTTKYFSKETLRQRKYKSTSVVECHKNSQSDYMYACLLTYCCYCCSQDQGSNQWGNLTSNVQTIFELVHRHLIIKENGNINVLHNLESVMLMHSKKTNCSGSIYVICHRRCLLYPLQIKQVGSFCLIECYFKVRIISSVQDLNKIREMTKNI